MAAILYRGVGVHRVFEDHDVAAALKDGWYVLTPAGHVALPEPESASADVVIEPETDAEPVKRKPGRPRKT
jgi:hypothetical protein